MQRALSTTKALETLTSSEEIKQYIQSKMIAAFSKQMRLVNCEWKTVGIHPNYNSYVGFSAKEWFMLRELLFKAGLIDSGENAHLKVISQIKWQDDLGNKYALTYSTVNVFAVHGFLRTRHEFGWSFTPTGK